MPRQVIRMAPKPRRLISISPPILKVPDFAALIVDMTVSPVPDDGSIGGADVIKADVDSANGMGLERTPIKSR
jgi:hypothetical protein